MPDLQGSRFSPPQPEDGESGRGDGGLADQDAGPRRAERREHAGQPVPEAVVDRVRQIGLDHVAGVAVVVFRAFAEKAAMPETPPLSVSYALMSRPVAR